MSHELKITHRHLPHWTIDDSIYFVTFCAYDTFFDENERHIILEHIKEGNGTFYECFAAIVMPDHVHVLLHAMEGMTLSRIMHGMKGVSAHKINLHRHTKGKIWQNESYDRIVRDGNEFDVILNYMYNNPIKKGLSEDTDHYIGWYYNEEKFG
jgi:REP element-mobilizing transposase RayT